MKFKSIGLIATLLFFTSSTFATEYIYRKLMANTLPSAKCELKEKALETATKAYTLNKYSKKFCQTQGYGWHVEKVVDSGKPICDICETAANSDSQRCHVEDVVVECKRIKPGSVGMLPGKG